MEAEALAAEIEAQVQEWSSNSNDCFTVELKRGDGSIAASFQPDFTYPIFGEEEAIFGYQDLDINLSFAAHNLKPHLTISYEKKFPAQGEVKPTDIHEALRDFLPDVAFSSLSTDEALQDDDAADFTPPGDKIHEYSRGGDKYEVWCASLSDPAAKELLENMQILVPMFIEGGSTLQIEQDWTTQRWKLYLLYHVQSDDSSPSSSPYSLTGYGTSYRVFTFPDRSKPLQADLNVFLPSTQSVLDFLPPLESAVPNDFTPTAYPNNISSPLDLPSRERLSQFLVLPSFQHGGHGQELYHAMYTHLTKPSNIRELTVEDPNESFDDLRDLCDLLHLRAHVPEFAALRINTDITSANLTASEAIPTSLIIPTEIRDAIRTTTKIMPRQLDRLIEMHTLSFIPPLHRSRSRITRKEKASNPLDRMYYFWRLYVKERLYIFNRDQLVQVEREERFEKLESAVDAVVEGYVKVLEKVEERERRGFGVANGEAEVVEGASQKGRERKRKVVVDDDEEEDEDDAEGQNGIVNGHKKPRTG
ncbi:acyl-CoA N-acyltransferase [Neohortaea acidophila]|uniref:Histone acetyltransferase type B catalytic subunit n=1 Tax=Neohortaea acidophila TaxID=245834 RepID=A0A6A6PNH2_9PEZI|nr:acyl-CoA N-acyltransferase [Neohortaea acidophila]KAF2481648.1 acyl-CoA N-acyltransferase [Neohortaea acidophila]